MELIIWLVIIAGGALALCALPAIIVFVIALVVEALPLVLALVVCWWIFQWLV